jgi:hypothetical protein
VSPSLQEHSFIVLCNIFAEKCNFLMENSLFMLFCTLFFHMNKLHNAMNVKASERTLQRRSKKKKRRKILSVRLSLVGERNEKFLKDFFAHFRKTAILSSNFLLLLVVLSLRRFFFQKEKY